MNRAPDLTTAAWRKSSYSDGGGTNCLEVSDDHPGTVPVRDSKRPDGPILVFAAGPWGAFLAGVKTEGSARTRG
ncbi:DUF397 domain-containing protein [Streptomyces luteogriseus]|uniref:DUF397 domain-containing protein n=1 Tax=Streptomyces luteogriseus TaxID=68233 RepID=UPI002E2FD3C9|nr:DUF397 domain-containing protein [Streptomyces luteogriseus]WTJ29591.1 DUF397 domain-containing protein [Streptomyces luteogriseus]